MMQRRLAPNAFLRHVFAALRPLRDSNCYESFPIAGGLMLLALATGRTHITDPLALWFLLARVGQSTTHLISTNAQAVQVRFLFFLVQFAIAVWWVIALLGSSAA